MSALRLRCRCGAEIEASGMTVTTLNDPNGTTREETHSFAPVLTAWKREHVGCMSLPGEEAAIQRVLQIFYSEGWTKSECVRLLARDCVRAVRA